MPGFDNTGPNGQGQGTGRRMGPCFSSNYQRGAGGRRMGNRQMGARGQGQGQGFRFQRNRFANQTEPVAEPYDDVTMIDDQANNIEQRMNNIEEKLDALLKNLAPASPASEKKPDSAK